MQVISRLMDYIVSFIYDEDLREATIHEVICFFKTIAHPRSPWIIVDVFSNLATFFTQVSQRFKHYLTNLWLFSSKITSPCQFGRQSNTLFLCMECHKEHY